MKIEIKKAVIEFRSNNKYYDIEKNGKKPNTIRELTDEEIQQALTATHIRIVSANGQDKFERELTDISIVDDVIKLAVDCRKLVVFSWNHESPASSWTPHKTEAPSIIPKRSPHDPQVWY